jgi:hypothetical protein
MALTMGDWPFGDIGQDGGSWTLPLLMEREGKFG